MRAAERCYCTPDSIPPALVRHANCPTHGDGTPWWTRVLAHAATLAPKSASEAAVQAMAGALCRPDSNQWRGAYGSIPADPDAWHYETDGTCSYDTKKAARIALAALVASPDVRAALVDDALAGIVAERPTEPRSDWEYVAGIATDAILAALTPEPQ